MAILDSQGRLFGKVSLLDLGAAFVILLVIGGIFLFPGNSGSVAQLGVQTKPVEVDVMIRGLTVAHPEEFITFIRQSGKADIIIRNQPAGQVEIKAVKELPRTVAAPQPDGSLKAIPDPRPELDYTADMLITLNGNAEIVDSGPVLGGTKIKIGTPLELEGQTYRFNASVVGVTISQ